MPTTRSLTHALALVATSISKTTAFQFERKNAGSGLLFSAAANPGCLNDRLGSTYRTGFSCPKKRGHLLDTPTTRNWDVAHTFSAVRGDHKVDTAVGCPTAPFVDGRVLSEPALPDHRFLSLLRMLALILHWISYQRATFKPGPKESLSTGRAGFAAWMPGGKRAYPGAISMFANTQPMVLLGYDWMFAQNT